MRTVLLQIFLGFISYNLSSQVNLDKVTSPTNGECNGSIAFSSGLTAEENSFTLLESQDQLDTQYGTGSLDNLCPGTYTIQYTGIDGCTYTNTVILEECNDFSYTINTKPPCSNNSVDGGISIIFDDCSDCIIQWENNSTTNNLIGIESGIYRGIIVSETGCKESIEVELITTELNIEFVDIKISDPGHIEINIEGGIEPYNINWVDADNVIQSIQQQGKTILLNEILENHTLDVYVTDRSGCSAMESIFLEKCIPSLISKSFVVDPFSIEFCDDFKLRLVRKHTSSPDNFVTIDLFTYSAPLIAPLFVSSFSGKLNSTYNDVQYIDLPIGKEGRYSVTITDQCGEQYDLDLGYLNCDNCPALLGVPVYRDFGTCEIWEGSGLYLPNFLEDLDLVCQQQIANYSYINSTYICSGNDFDYKVLLPDNSIYRVWREGNDINNSAIIPSNNMEDGYFWKITQKGRYKVRVAYSNSCTSVSDFNFNYIPESRIIGIGFYDDEFEGIVQGFKVDCETCLAPDFPISYVEQNLKPNCINKFTYHPFDETRPCEMGGIVNVSELGQIVIPAYTPYYDPNSSYQTNDDCIECLFSAGYATEPAFQAYPILVEYCGQNPTEEDENCILDCNCDFEFTQPSSTSCLLDVYCYDDPVNPVFLGTIVDKEATVPCMKTVNGQCEIVAYCQESDDYVMIDGSYYIYEEFDCAFDNIPYCTDVEVNDFEPFNPICGTECLVEQNSPNPWVNETSIPFCNAVPGNITFTVHSDANCNNAIYTETKFFESGYNSFILLDNSLLPPSGTLCYEIHHENGCYFGNEIMLRLTSLNDPNGGNGTNLADNSNPSNLGEPQANEYFKSTTESLSIKVFPVPTKDIIYIEMNNYEKLNTVFAIYNLNGKLLINESSKSNLTEIDVSILSKGIYILHLVSGNGNQSYKRIIVL